MSLFGCHKKSTILDGGVQVKTVAEDAPTFKREYKVALTNGRSMTITIKNYGFNSGISYTGELDQPGGNWVLFHPQKVADKILDPAIVPVVQSYCDQIISTDAEWRKTKPDSFTDNEGHTWKRQ